MVICNFLPRPESRETIKSFNKVGKNDKCQGGVYFFINIFTISRELDAKCMAENTEFIEVYLR